MIIINYNSSNKTIEIITKNIAINGGEGSGNFGHEGRPGKVGGSGEGQGSESNKTKEEVNNIIKQGEKKKRSDKLICKDISNLDFIKNFHEQDNLKFEVLEQPPQKDNSYLFYESGKKTAKKPSTYYIMKKGNDYYYVRGSDHWKNFGTNLSAYSDKDIQDIIDASEKMSPNEFIEKYELNFSRFFLDQETKDKIKKEIYKSDDDYPEIFRRYREEEAKKFKEMSDQEKKKLLDDMSDHYGRIGRKIHKWNINDDKEGYKYGAIKIN